jgi:hypothetical protein
VDGLRRAYELPSKHVTEGKIDDRIEVERRRERRRKQLLNDLEEKTGYW